MEKNKEKLSKFAVVLSRLRKERGISQKKAATDLGISQALLSHYEKGIRECGLDFVIKCSRYYGVTTDYLLGVSDSRNGVDTSGLASVDDNGEYSVSTLAKATKDILDIVSASVSGEREKKLICDYYMLCVYHGALTLEKAGAVPKDLFKLDYSLGRELSSAAIAVEDAKAAFIEDKSHSGSELTRRTALGDLINEAEKFILENYKPE